jgi:hypothetical protein
MKESDRLKRDMRIVEMYENGATPAVIGKAVGLRADRIRQILKNRGYVFDFKPPGTSGDTIWEQGEHKRRNAIWERARRAARAALQEIA